MPWKSKDAMKHTKKADTPKEQKMWAKIANAALRSGKDEAAAIRIANAAIKRKSERSR